MGSLRDKQSQPWYFNPNKAITHIDSVGMTWGTVVKKPGERESKGREADSLKVAIYLVRRRLPVSQISPEGVT